MTGSMTEHVCVVLGRFQVPELTAGQGHILQLAAMAGNRLAVVLGTTEKPNKRNPLPYEMRRDMLLQHPLVKMVLPHADVPGDNATWSKNLDQLLKLVFPGAYIELFAGRDSFKPCYTGTLKVREIGEHTVFCVASSGTASRESITPADSPVFRAGVIWAVNNYGPHEPWKDYEA